jgi:flotillin
VLITETMPEVARAFRGSFERVNVTSTNGGEMFGFLSAGLDQVLALARDSGTRDPGTKR